MDKDIAENIVKVYAILAWIGAFFSALWGLGFLFAGSLFGGGWGYGMGGAWFMGSMLGTLGMFSGILFLAVAVAEFFIGMALWKRQDWARTGGLVFSIISLFFGGLGILVGGFGIYFFGFDETAKGLLGASPSAAKRRK
jgi:hypothetical protein